MLVSHCLTVVIHGFPKSMYYFFILGTSPLAGHLRKTAIPSQFDWIKPPTPDVISRSDRVKARYARRKILRDISDFESKQLEKVDHDIDVLEETVGLQESLNETVEQESMEVQFNEFEDMSTQTPKQPMMSIENFHGDDAGVHFYTGIESVEKCFLILNTLGPAAYCLNYVYKRVTHISVPNQFFLVLMKLRRHTTNFELTRLFDLSDRTMCNIFLTWILFMSKQWRELDIWPSRDLVSYFCPTDFKAKFPKTRVIVDGTECGIKRPKMPKAQQSTFSSYKNKNTIKILVGATPGGLVSFVSLAYGGSTSDRQLCERSSLMNLCEPGDSINGRQGL